MKEGMVGKAFILECISKDKKNLRDLPESI